MRGVDDDLGQRGVVERLPVLRRRRSGVAPGLEEHQLRGEPARRPRVAARRDPLDAGGDLVDHDDERRVAQAGGDLVRGHCPRRPAEHHVRAVPPELADGGGVSVGQVGARRQPTLPDRRDIGGERVLHQRRGGPRAHRQTSARPNLLHHRAITTQ
nr:hypothetical protein [Pseudonocardia sulfidoxydans]